MHGRDVAFPLQGRVCGGDFDDRGKKRRRIQLFHSVSRNHGRRLGMLVLMVVIAGNPGDAIARILRNMEFVVSRLQRVTDEMPDTPNARQEPDD